MTISKLAFVETDEIGSGTRIDPFAVVCAGATLGRNVVLHPHVTVNAGVIIGDGTEVFPGAFLGKEPNGAGAVSRQQVFRPRTTIGKSCVIGANATVYYDVEIGHNTLIGDGASIREQCRIGSFCVVSRCVTINYNSTIGDRTKVMDLTHITGNMVIGDDVFISAHVSTTNDNRMGAEGYEEDRIRGPIIEDRAAIGAGAILLPGVVVGRNSVVGAGAVVTASVPAFAQVLGVPARVVRKLPERGPNEPSPPDEGKGDCQ